MTKKTGLYLMLAGAAVSLYDLMGTGNPVYGSGKPLASMRWKVYTTTTAPVKDYYVSISDIAAVAGAYLYFR